jgi:hypothetical protein
MFVFIDIAILRMFQKEACLIAACYSSYCVRRGDMRGGGIYPLILNLDSRTGRMVSFTPRVLTPSVTLVGAQAEIQILHFQKH